MSNETIKQSNGCKLTKTNDCYLLTSNATGTHRICLDSTPERLAAHWKGFLSNQPEQEIAATTKRKKDNPFLTSDIVITTDSQGYMNAKHRRQGELIDHCYFKTRAECRREAVIILRDIKEYDI